MKKPETPRQAEAFAYYLKLGSRRNLDKVSIKYEVSKATIGNWSLLHNWQKRIAKADGKKTKTIKKKAIRLYHDDEKWLNKQKSHLLNKMVKNSEKSPSNKNIKIAFNSIKTELGEPERITKSEIGTPDGSPLAVANILVVHLEPKKDDK